MDLLDAAKVAPPKTWDEFVEVCKKLQKPPKLTGYGMCLGLHSDADNDIMNMIWSYGGKLVEADNKTVALHSQGTIAGGAVHCRYVYQAQDHPQGRDRVGQYRATTRPINRGRSSLSLNPTSIYAHLADSDKELYDVTGLLPVPAGPAGAIDALGTTEWLLFKHNPYPEVAKGLAEYWMAPENLRVTIEEGDGRWGPPYKGMYESDFWKRPAFQYWRTMLERGRQFAVRRES